ncbi:hypothetical protein XOC_0608 [Xanthomonas oryzae pv. oryzicola BLS256]|uniref:Uncharacterized protein n=1 Tax=Xanthomonas oryzae pv. oryzicola (strain BLS256) TaxID=383407 RepID=G7TBD7_XANOB|nr:hypothetical protein XOC_0608 [Xanthomonas oryzae pv. oryzicola BLS256]
MRRGRIRLLRVRRRAAACAAAPARHRAFSGQVRVRPTGRCRNRHAWRRWLAACRISRVRSPHVVATAPLPPLSAVAPAGPPLVPSAPAAQKPPSGVAIGLIGVVTCVVLFGLLVLAAPIWLMSMR